MCFTKTWLHKHIPDSNSTIPGFQTIQAESADWAVRRKVERLQCSWQTLLKGHFCSPDTEPLAVSQCPYYLQREFTCYCLCLHPAISWCQPSMWHLDDESQPDCKWTVIRTKDPHNGHPTLNHQHFPTDQEGKWALCHLPTLWLFPAVRWKKWSRTKQQVQRVSARVLKASYAGFKFQIQILFV